jgi:hypothetical protein
MQAQQQTYSEMYTPSAGDTLDENERNRYGLFPSVNRFRRVAFLQNGQRSLTARGLMMLGDALNEISVPQFGSIHALETMVVIK